jgi:hypothetical protein
MLKAKTIKSEKGLRDLIARNLRKEIHPGTKPSVDFIAKVLEDAHESGMKYDVTDLRPKIIAFANNSSNQAQTALKVVQTMKWASEHEKDSEIVEVSTTAWSYSMSKSTRISSSSAGNSEAPTKLYA